MHKTKDLEHKALSSGEIAVLVRCCDDPKTDMWVTISGLHKLSDSEIDAMIEAHHSHVQQVHEGLQRALAHIQKRMPVIEPERERDPAVVARQASKKVVEMKDL